MYIEGIVTEVDRKALKVKLKDIDHDNFETPWLSVPQLWTAGNKSRWLPEEGTLMAAILSDDMSYGAVLGAIYNDEDSVPSLYEDKDFIMFDDGAVISHTPGTAEFDVEALNLNVFGNINCSGEINDLTGTMSAIRALYNTHTHGNGNNGANTSTPNQKF